MLHDTDFQALAIPTTLIRLHAVRPLPFYLSVKLQPTHSLVADVQHLCETINLLKLIN